MERTLQAKCTSSESRRGPGVGSHTSSNALPRHSVLSTSPNVCRCLTSLILAGQLTVDFMARVGKIPPKIARTHCIARKQRVGEASATLAFAPLTRRPGTVNARGGNFSLLEGVYGTL